ncbi:hypothetical protein J6590_075692 [Homalodisca vitripennis]|nr:hypothetical protein J6590_075692 [Homalodisca vitripennis]
MREATDVDRCFEKIALGAIPQIRLSTSVRFCEVGHVKFYVYDSSYTTLADNLLQHYDVNQ